MGLFQNSVLNKYKKLQDKKAIEKAFKKYTKYFHNPKIQQNIRESKEEQYQEGFLRELFVNVMDYTINPNPDYNLTTELKNEKGAKKTDGAILSRGHDPLAKQFALAVIELKGTKTKDLESIRQQAFDYKANQSGCIYVITSNFEKLRFYINNAVEFEEFNLFTLNAEQFELLYLCLHKENLLRNIPLKINTDSVVAEEQITKTFYNDYSLFKRELFRDLVKKNVKNEVFRDELQKEDNDRATKNIKLTLFKKSQKLIDRFLFIFFAEDKGLLPPNSTLKILQDWDKLNELDTEIPLYNRFKLYFKYLDEGRKGTDKKAEIFAYNGGLFKPDPILDSLLIDNELLNKHTKILSDYDFESQVGVNILGHIFENSLNEIESINAEIEGQEFDKQKTKRKKDGVFYTPKYITKYIVDNTVGKLCAEKKTELGVVETEYQKSRKGRNKDTIKKLKTNLDNYRDWLLELTILDPACGSGAFLNQALDFLIKEHTYIDELETSLFGSSMVFQNIENTILEKNIFGVDLNEESVEIAKLSLWLRTAQPRRKLNTLNNNIKCGNSLIDDPKIAGDKAFNWQNEFPNIFKEKEKKAYHITTATHDSRTSQRMIDHKVRLLRDNGTRPKAEGIWMDAEDDLLITKTISEIVKKDNLTIMAYDICGDHIHMLLVCEEEQLTSIVGKIKAMTSRARNIAKGYTTEKSESESDTTRGHVPLSKAKKKTYNSLWTQKFGNNPIKDDNQLNNTLTYIQKNRAKHELPPHSKKIKTIIQNMCVDYKTAMKPEFGGGFDVVIGNPPYVRQELVKEYSSTLKKYQVFSGKGDLYTYFFEKAHSVLKQNGYLSFISSGKFFEASYGKPLVTFLVDKFKFCEVINFDDLDVFQGISAYPLIFIGKKENNIKDYSFNYCFVPDYSFNSISEIVSNFPFSQIMISDFKEFDFNFYSKRVAKLFKKINKNSSFLKDIGCLPLVGVKTGYNEGFLVEEKNKLSKPYIFGKNLKKYLPPISSSDIIFPYKRNNEEYILIEEVELQNINGILEDNRSRLETRAIIKEGIINGSKKWYEYQQVNRKLDFNKEYIVYPNVSLGTNFTLSKGNVIDMTGFIIPSNDKFLLTLLNSKICEFVMRKLAITRQGGYQEYKVQYLEKVPLKIINDANKKEFIDNTDERIKLTYNFYKLSLSFQKYLQSQFSIEKLSRKLQNWHELEFGEFIKEVNKAIKKENKERIKADPIVIGLTPIATLTKTDEMDWMDVFETKKAEAQTLKAEIDKTDNEIDQMVYELYELTADEIAIIENSTK